VIRGDLDALGRAVTNLLENALRYAPEGSPVRLTLQDRPDGIEIRVADSGPGIPKADQARIFERFARLDSARTDRQNAGLGLAIVRTIAEAHGGKVWVESELGNGATFFILLPKTHKNLTTAP
jgi:signal transduction histidine kinase